MNRGQKGFTLIELLVVIAIISLLSSIVMASLTSAKITARETALKQQLKQLATLMEQEYLDKNSYAGLYTAGWGSSETNASAGQYPCDTIYPPSSTASKYISNANAICKKIVELTGPNEYSLYVTSGGNKFSVQGWFTPRGLLYCVGSSGNTFGAPWTGLNAQGSPRVYIENVGCGGNP